MIDVLRRLLFLGAGLAVLACGAAPPAPSAVQPSSGQPTAPATTVQAPATNAAPTVEPTTAQTVTPVATTPAVGSAWQSVLDSIGDDGSVSKDTALQAFSLAIGPLPGVTIPQGDPGLIHSGTFAVRALVSHWSELTADQQQAAIGYLPELAGLQGLAPNIVLAAQNRTDDYYTQVAKDEFNEIGAHLQSAVNIGLTIQARVGLPLQAGSAAEASVLSAGGGYSGTPARCVIAVSHWLDNRGETDVKAALAHEAWHCYEGAIIGLARYWSNNPAPWIIEGEAEWVGATLVPDAPIMEAFWPPYLTNPAKPLFKQSYEAIGFYSQLDSSGTDPWTTLVDILEAPDSASAFAAAGADQDAFLDRWASGFLRDDSRGDPWQISGPAITPDKSSLNGIHLNNGDSIGVSSAPYANDISEFDGTPDVLQAAISGHARISDSNGHDYLVGGEGDFCMLTTGCDCPDTDQPPPLALDGDAVVLALTGGPAGSSGTLVGTKLDDYCNKGIAGTWTGTWTNSPDFGNPPATGGFTVTFTQTGNQITGVASVTGPTCVTGGNSTGTITGNSIQFGFLADPQRPVQFEGTVLGNSMSGTWNAIACGKYAIPIYGTWTATRAASSPRP